MSVPQLFVQTVGITAATVGREKTVLIDAKKFTHIKIKQQKKDPSQAERNVVEKSLFRHYSRRANEDNRIQ